MRERFLQREAENKVAGAGNIIKRRGVFLRLKIFHCMLTGITHLEVKFDDSREKKDMIGAKTLNRRQDMGSSVEGKSLAIMVNHYDGCGNNVFGHNCS